MHLTALRHLNFVCIGVTDNPVNLTIMFQIRPLSVAEFGFHLHTAEKFDFSI